MQVGSNYFQSFLKKADEKSLYKMKHYPEIYDEHSELAERSLLEIGVFKGGSLHVARFFETQSDFQISIRL